MADPFVAWYGDAAYCFVEDYDWATMQGSIGAYRIGRDHAEWVGTALSEPFHLSFPYVFSCQGRHNMIPETHESRQIRLYETDSFPLGWRLKHVLMENVSAVDTMDFEWLGRWWLLASMTSRTPAITRRSSLPSSATIS